MYRETPKSETEEVRNYVVPDADKCQCIFLDSITRLKVQGNDLVYIMIDGTCDAWKYPNHEEAVKEMGVVAKAKQRWDERKARLASSVTIKAGE